MFYTLFIGFCAVLKPGYQVVPLIGYCVDRKIGYFAKFFVAQHNTVSNKRTPLTAK